MKMSNIHLYIFHLSFLGLRLEFELGLDLGLVFE